MGFEIAILSWSLPHTSGTFHFAVSLHGHFMPDPRFLPALRIAFVPSRAGFAFALTKLEARHWESQSPSHHPPFPPFMVHKRQLWPLGSFPLGRPCQCGLTRERLGAGVQGWVRPNRIEKRAGPHIFPGPWHGTKATGRGGGGLHLSASINKAFNLEPPSLHPCPRKSSPLPTPPQVQGP